MAAKKLGEYLVELGFVTPEQVDQAVAAKRRGEFPDLRLGDILIKQGILDRAKLDQAIEKQMLDMYEM